MDLGASIRRRRRAQGSTSGSPRGKRRSGRPGRRARKGEGAGPLGRLQRIGLALAVAAGGFGAGYVAATRVVFPLPELPTDLQEVPDLRGAPLRVALAALTEAGLQVERIDSLRHPTLPAGVVVGQSPLPGPTALPGAALRVAVSVGPETRLVPDVRRWQEERAAALMRESGFNVRIDTVESGLPAGQIVQTQPLPDVQVQVPSDVLLLVSLGPPTFPLPDLDGRTEVEALRRLRLLGLRVVGVDRRPSLLNVGAVFGQWPDPGDPVQKGDSVRLVVGQRIPGLVGRSLRRPPPPDSGGLGRSGNPGGR